MSGYTAMKRNLSLLGLAAAALAVGYGVTKLWNTSPFDPPSMVWVPGGEFTMGTDSELGWPDEKPAHRVRVDGFWPACHTSASAACNRH